MPKRPFHLWPGGRTVSASGDEHQGAPRYQDWRDGREASIVGELSNITGTKSVASRRHLACRPIAGDDLRIRVSKIVRTGLSIVTGSQIRRIVKNSYATNSSPPGFSMTSPAETALTLVVVKSVAIVGSALVAVLLLAVVGTKRR